MYHTTGFGAKLIEWIKRLASVCQGSVTIKGRGCVSGQGAQSVDCTFHSSCDIWRLKRNT